MPLLTAENLAKYYGAQDVFGDISLQINYGDKIALVGPNGEGKSTLLRIIAGLEEPTAGQIHRKRGLNIGFLPQQSELAGERTLWQEMKQVFSHLQAMEVNLRRLERQMAQEGAPLTRYSALLEEFERQGGYVYNARIHQVLAGLGFKEGSFEQSLNQLSGGESTRALLARLLLKNPDLLLLDEPTNHLDFKAIEWLESWLRDWSGSLIVVAHDRYFLDRVVNQVWDLSFGELEVYRGNYSTYVELRDARRERRLKEYEAQQKHIASTEDFIRRYHAGQRSKEARGRATRLARLERLDEPRRHKAFHLSIQPSTRSGELVLASQDLTIGYLGRSLFTCPDLELRRGECAALLGPNGSGKTTFLRTFMGRVEPLAGRIWLGHNVIGGYLTQDQEGLDSESAILDEILRVKDLRLQRARTFLGGFLFSGNDVFKRISALSGGERSRVALAKLTLQGANFLVLDEPTNHLDIVSREILIDVLARFQGTILFVSHDRSLVDHLSTQVWVIEGPELSVHRGNYSDYLAAREVEKKEEEPMPVQPVTSRRPTSTGGDRKGQHLPQVKVLEQQIAELENRLSELEQELNSASQARLVEDLHRLGREYETTQQRLQKLLEEWARAEGV